MIEVRYVFNGRWTIAGRHRSWYAIRGTDHGLNSYSSLWAVLDAAQNSFGCFYRSFNDRSAAMKWIKTREQLAVGCSGNAVLNPQLYLEPYFAPRSTVVGL